MKKKKEATIRVRVLRSLEEKLKKAAAEQDYANLSEFLEERFRRLVAEFEREHPGCFDDLPSQKGKKRGAVIDGDGNGSSNLSPLTINFSPTARPPVNES